MPKNTYELKWRPTRSEFIKTMGPFIMDYIDSSVYTKRTSLLQKKIRYVQNGYQRNGSNFLFNRGKKDVEIILAFDPKLWEDSLVPQSDEWILNTVLLSQTFRSKLVSEKDLVASSNSPREIMKEIIFIKSRFFSHDYWCDRVVDAIYRTYRVYGNTQNCYFEIERLSKDPFYPIQFRKKCAIEMERSEKRCGADITKKKNDLKTLLCNNGSKYQIEKLKAEIDVFIPNIFLSEEN